MQVGCNTLLLNHLQYNAKRKKTRREKANEVKEDRKQAREGVKLDSV